MKRQHEDKPVGFGNLNQFSDQKKTEKKGTHNLYIIKLTLKN